MHVRFGYLDRVFADCGSVSVLCRKGKGVVLIEVAPKSIGLSFSAVTLLILLIFLSSQGSYLSPNDLMTCLSFDTNPAFV